MMTKDRSVCVVIPAFNEAAVIYDVIKNMSKLLKKKYRVFEIVVIDDGSSDKTASEAARAGANVVRHILNSGAGGATATGLSYASKTSCDAAATMDADGQHDPEDVIHGFDRIFSGNEDLLIGSRLIDSTGMSRVKIMGNKGLSLITYLLFGIKTTDSQSGLRIFSVNALKRLRWETSGYEFCSEMLWRAHQIHLSVGEFPIKAIYTDYSISKGQNNWNAINITKSLLSRRISEIIR